MANLQRVTITVNGTQDIGYGGGKGVIDFRSADYDSASVTFDASFDGGLNFQDLSTSFLSSISAVTANGVVLIKETMPPCQLRFTTASKGGDVNKPVVVSVTQVGI